MCCYAKRIKYIVFRNVRISCRDATRNYACVSRLNLSLFHRWLLYRAFTICTSVTFVTRLLVASKLKCTKIRRIVFLRHAKIRQMAKVT